MFGIKLVNLNNAYSLLSIIKIFFILNFNIFKIKLHPIDPPPPVISIFLFFRLLAVSLILIFKVFLKKISSKEKSLNSF